MRKKFLKRMFFLVVFSLIVSAMIGTLVFAETTLNDTFYTITFDGNGFGDTICELQVKSGDTLHEVLHELSLEDGWHKIMPEDFYYDGSKWYQLVDYTYDESGENVFDYDAPICNDITIYAVWYPITPIDQIDISIEAPKAGTLIVFSGDYPYYYPNVSIPSDVDYKLDMKDDDTPFCYWYADSAGKEVFKGTMEAGVTYYADVWVVPKNNDCSFTKDVKVIINSGDIEYSMIRNADFLVSCIVPIKAVEPELEKIVTAYNNNSLLKTYAWVFNATCVASIAEDNPDTLIITVKEEEDTIVLKFKLEGDILVGEDIPKDYELESMYLADSVGYLHGYNYGDVYSTLSNFPYDVAEYTVEDEGYEILKNDTTVSIKIDTSKKIPLIDESEYYMHKEDFSRIKRLIESGESGDQTYMNRYLAYSVIVGEKENEIYMGEREELTQKSYKSILSALEVMYGVDAVEYFKDNYPELVDGITTFDGFEVYCDYEIDADKVETMFFDNKKVVFVKIDNAYMKDVFLRKEYIGEVIESGEKTLTIDFINNTYQLGFFDSVKEGGDIAFLFKYILEPVVTEAGYTPNGDTIYFTISNDKIIIGDEKNSILKVVIAEDHLDILPSKPNDSRTTVVAKHDDVKSREYDLCDFAGHQHVRYINQDVTVNITYGKMSRTSSGGGGSSSSYKITTKIDNGTITPENINVKKNNNQEFNFEASEGYEIIDVLVDGKSIGAVKSYTLKKITEKHTIEVKTQKISPLDKVDDWAKEEMAKAEEFGLIPETFVRMDATRAITRADFATIAVKLYEALTGTKAQKIQNNPFVDTESEYVLKAYNLGITKGISETEFGNGTITREQLATMIVRCLNKAGIETIIDIENVTIFADDNEMHDWGRLSVYSMASKEIIKGFGDNTFNPLGEAKVEEALAIALRCVEAYKN